jgi:cytochrome c peroxidase
LAACNSDQEGGTDAALRSLIRTHELTGDPAAGHELPSVDEPLAQLGLKLFFS